MGRGTQRSTSRILGKQTLLGHPRRQQRRLWTWCGLTPGQLSPTQPLAGWGGQGAEVGGWMLGQRQWNR